MGDRLKRFGVEASLCYSEAPATARERDRDGASSHRAMRSGYRVRSNAFGHTPSNGSSFRGET
jgi:hypothetical protein